ncbi:MAG: amidohydrolase [Desulfobulbaceae bacterium]|nr:amidohydrolase [Desulfobulbaceae bacterium]
MNQDILITNVVALSSPDSNNPLPSAFIAIKDGLISEIGPMDQLGEHKASTIINGENQLAMPGLVNTHCHAPMTLFRGYADDLQLMEWLNENIFPAEAKNVNPDMVYWCTKLAAAEMILSGTTMVADAYFHEHDAARAFCEIGLRAVVSHGVIDFPAPGVPDPSRNIEAVETFIDYWTDRDPLITPAVFAHSPYTCSPTTLQKAKELSRAKGLKFFIHAAETEHEASIMIEPKGDSPIRHLAALGILDDDTVCIHCVWLDKEDLHILAQSGAGVSTCPQSNLKLASGMAPLAQMLSLGIPLGLGTDGPASNNTLDMFREMDICAKIHKIREKNPVAVPAKTILKLATTEGKKLLAGNNAITGLKVGAPADLILITLNSPHLQPFYHPDLLCYSPCGAEVNSSIINGRLVMHQRKLLTIDLAETTNRVRELATKLQ